MRDASSQGPVCLRRTGIGESRGRTVWDRMKKNGGSPDGDPPT